MASHNHRLQPAAYLDRMGMPGGDMSSYVRRYANYLNEKRDAYKLTGYDFCKIKRGFVLSWRTLVENVHFVFFCRKDDGVLRTMPTDKVGDRFLLNLDALFDILVAESTSNPSKTTRCFTRI